jgi:hypothetical protein
METALSSQEVRLLVQAAHKPGHSPRLGVKDDEAAIRSVKSAFTLLPLRNLLTIKALSHLQRKVASYSEFNKMVPSNLAIVFSPSLFRSVADEIEVILKESQEANLLAERFITHYDEFFTVRSSPCALLLSQGHRQRIGMT